MKVLVDLADGEHESVQVKTAVPDANANRIAAAYVEMDWLWL